MLDILSKLGSKTGGLGKAGGALGGLKSIAVTKPALGGLASGVKNAGGQIAGGIHGGIEPMADPGGGGTSKWGERKEKLAGMMGDLGQLFNREPAEDAPMQPGMIAEPTQPMQMPQIQYQQGQPMNMEDERRRRMMMGLG